MYCISLVQNSGNMYVANPVYLNSASRYRPECPSGLFPSTVHFFHLPLIVLIDVGCSFLFGRHLLLSVLSFRIFSLFILFLSRFLYRLIFFIRFPPHCVSLQSIFKPVLGNDSAKSANDRGLKIDANVVLYEETVKRFKAVDSATISGAIVPETDEFQGRLYGVDLYRGSGSYSSS